MTKVKIAYAISFVLFFAMSAFADEQAGNQTTKGCISEGYSERIFLYPQADQKGTFIVSKEGLLNPVNLTPDASDWMNQYWEEVARTHEGQQYAAFSVNRNKDGAVCVVAVIAPELQTRDDAGIAATTVTTSTRQQKSGLITKIFRVLLGYGPLALGFAGPVGVVSGLGLSVAGPKIDSMLTKGNGRSQGHTEISAQQSSKSSKKKKFDHDENGSFANLWK